MYDGMTYKQLDARLNEWLFKLFATPILIFAPYFRTNYWLDGRDIFVKHPFRKSISVRIEELDEIGVETTDQGPFIEDVFWILKQGDLRMRIGFPHPIFRKLMDRFSSLKGFDWEPFNEAMSCTDNRYFVCLRRPLAPAE
jgi:hypothetical protein